MGLSTSMRSSVLRPNQHRPKDSFSTELVTLSPAAESLHQSTKLGDFASFSELLLLTGEWLPHRRPELVPDAQMSGPSDPGFRQFLVGIGQLAESIAYHFAGSAKVEHRDGDADNHVGPYAVELPHRHRS